MLTAPPTLEWTGGPTGCLRLIDQTRLPGELVWVECRTLDVVREAIVSLRVRGAPAIGVAAAYGVVVGCQTAREFSTSRFLDRLDEVVASLASSRPTAVNLFAALNRLQSVVHELAASGTTESAALLDRLLSEARAIENEDRVMCLAIGRHGSPMLKSGMSVLTHCNAGSLATAGDGTALAVIYAAVADGKQIHVYADETRPLLQGARLTAWELTQRGIPVTVLCDNMAAQLMKEGRVQMVITGADRIAANGDSANKIGTYGVAVLAKHHGIPFCIAAPSSTFDLSLPDGSGIPIEHRDPREVTQGFGRRTAPDGVQVFNPAFDVTPAELISAIITERGVILQPTTERVRAMIMAG
jgi:methylthioribose-1-phosphate isomerase